MRTSKISEEDRALWMEAYKLYATFLGMENTDGKWQLFCEAVNRLACEHDFHHNPAAMHMAEMLIDTFDELYREEPGDARA